MILKNVRIPKDNMLSRYVKVSKEGEFTKKGDEKIAYLGMIKLRLFII